MTKDELKALGLTDEQVEKITDDIGRNFVAKSQFNAKNDELKALKAERQTSQAELEKLKADNAENADLVKQLDALKAAQEKREQEHAAEMARVQLDAAVERSLMGAKAKNAKAVRALLDMEKVKLDGETLTGLDEQLNALKTSDAYLFETDTDERAAFTGLVPQGGADQQGAKSGIEQIIDGALANI